MELDRHPSDNEDPSLEVGGVQPVVNWESEPIGWNALEGTRYQMPEMYIGDEMVAIRMMELESYC